jgi:hypothetical protein
LAVAFPHLLDASGPHILRVDGTAPVRLSIQTYPMAAYFLREHTSAAGSVQHRLPLRNDGLRRQAANLSNVVSFSPDT